MFRKRSAPLVGIGLFQYIFGGINCYAMVGALGDRVGKKKMMLRSAGCLSLSYFIGAIVLSPVQLLGMRILQGFSFGFVSIGQAMVTSAAGRDTGKALGLFMSGRSAGTVMGPFIGVCWPLDGHPLVFLLRQDFGAMFAFFLVLFFCP